MTASVPVRAGVSAWNPLAVAAIWISLAVVIPAIVLFAVIGLAHVAWSTTA